MFIYDLQQQRQHGWQQRDALGAEPSEHSHNRRNCRAMLRN